MSTELGTELAKAPQQSSSDMAMLQSRRKEEEDGIQRRAKRRAAFLLEDRARLQRMSTVAQRQLIRQGLSALSRTEQCLFTELAELSRWREVISENYRFRQGQVAEASGTLQQLSDTLLEHVKGQEMRDFDAVVESDARHFHSGQVEYEENKKISGMNAAREVLDDVLQNVLTIIEYCDSHAIERVTQGPLGDLVMQDVISAHRCMFISGEPQRTVSIPSAMGLSLTAGAEAAGQSASLCRADNADLEISNSENNDYPSPHFCPPYMCRLANQTIYGAGTCGSPLCSAPFSALVAEMYTLLHPQPQRESLVPTSKKPIIMITGATFSGKSIVAQRIADMLKMRRITDTSLVEQALSAASHQSESESVKVKGLEAAHGESASFAKQSAVSLRSDLLNGNPTEAADEPSQVSGSVAAAAAGDEENVAGATGGEVVAPRADSIQTAHESAERSRMHCTVSIVEEPVGGPPATLRGLSDVGSEIHEALLAGRAVTPEMISQLIVMEMRSAIDDETCAGIILDGIPINAVGHKCLTELVSGACRPVAQQTFQHLLPVEHEDEELREILELFFGHHLTSGLLRQESTSDGSKDRALLRVVKPHDSPDVMLSSKKENKKGKKRDHAAESLGPVALPHVDELHFTEQEQALLQWYEEDFLQGNRCPYTSVVRVACPAAEIFKRFAGLRIDAETGDAYHLEYHPPPERRFPFLVHDDRARGPTTQLHQQVLQNIDEWDSDARWFAQYPNLVKMIDGEQQLDDVVQDALALVRAAKARASAEFERVSMAAELFEKKQQHLALRKKQLQAREEERKRLCSLYEERGLPIAPELMESVLEPEFLPVPPQLPPFWVESLHAYMNFFLVASCRVHKGLTDIAHFFHEYSKTCSVVIEKYWAEKPDGKQLLLNNFTTEFNSCPAALRTDVQGKEELHLRTDYLREALYSVTASRVMECSAVIDVLVSKGTFMEAWSDAVRALGAVLVQLELERFEALTNLIIIYFSAVVGEPFAFCCASPEVMTFLKARPETPVEPLKGKEKRGGGPKRGAVGKVEEAQEKANEDVFASALERGQQYLAATVAKFASPLPTALGNPKAKDAKRPVREESGGVATVGMPPGVTGLQTSVTGPASGPSTVGGPVYVLQLSNPLVEHEKQVTTSRLRVIQRYIADLLEDGEQHTRGIAKRLSEQSKLKQIQQMSAINTAIYHIRYAIEEERPLGTKHLGCDTFSPLPEPPSPSSLPLNIGTQPLEAGDPGAGVEAGSTLAAYVSGADRRSCSGDSPFIECVQLTPSLNSHRLHFIVKQFRCLAPSFRLSRDDFLSVVIEEDYACAAPGDRSRLLTPEQLFSSFDIHQCGLIDWREFACHLLLWSTAPPLPPSRGAVWSSGVDTGNDMGVGASPAVGTAPAPSSEHSRLYIDGPSASELIETRVDMGTSALHEEEFLDLPLFFDGKMTDERYGGFMRALWDIFSQDGVLNPVTLLLFLCADEQPIRGAQKAFYVASSYLKGDEAGSLTRAQLEMIFHIQAHCERGVGSNDPVSTEHLEYLFDGATLLTFDEVCARHMGRVLLNHSTTFLRKKFTHT